MSAEPFVLDLAANPHPVLLDLALRARRIAMMMPTGRHLTAGSELTVRGERGRVRFVEHVHNPRNGLSWIAVIDRKGHARSFTPDAIVRVHRITKTRENSQ